MAKFINSGDTIEAEHADICSRKIEWKGPKRHPDTNEIMMLYECSRNSSAEVIKIFTGDILDVTKHYHRDLGDMLEADSISVYSSSKRKDKIYVDEGVTSRHGAQFIDLRKRCISSIKYPLDNLIKCLEEKKMLSNN